MSLNDDDKPEQPTIATDTSTDAATGTDIGTDTGADIATDSTEGGQMGLAC